MRDLRKGIRKVPILITGGEGGIRTHGTRKGSTVFETARFNHSRTSPRWESRSIVSIPSEFGRMRRSRAD